MARLAARGSDPPVVFLADAEEEQLLLDSLTSGTTGFFTIDCTPDEFIEGLRSVLQGHYTVGTRLNAECGRASSAPGRQPLEVVLAVAMMARASSRPPLR